MSITNLGFGGVKTFDANKVETLESQNATSVFLISHLVGEAREQAKKEAGRVLGELRGMFLEYSFEDKGHLQRNTDLLNRQHRYEDEDGVVEGYKIGSFELLDEINYGGIFKSFVSSILLLELGQIECVSSINWKLGLRLDIKEGSKINLSDLGNALTDFIAGFIKTLGVKLEELETLERVDGDFKDILAKLPENFDETEKEKLLFSISQSVERNTIYFTDLTPIHPNFLRELLLYLDKRFGGAN